MLETAIALLFAHVLADFVLQTNVMVRDKARPHILALHGAIVAATAWAALGFPPAAGLILLVTLAHLMIDAIKIHLLAPGLRAFLSDQGAHIAVIALATAAFPDAYATGIWADPPRALETLSPAFAELPRTMALGAGLIATTFAGAYAVRELMTGFAPPQQMAGLPRGGQLIGILERLMILILVLLNEPAAIGFLIAAKSVLRFSDVKDDQFASEYVIIGTLASFAWALAVAWATAGALAALGP